MKRYRTMNLKIALSILFSVSICSLVGCSGDVDFKTLVGEHNKDNIDKVANAYNMMASRNKFAGPKSEDEFKQWLRDEPSIEKNLNFMDINREELDQYFIARDGLPFKIRYGLRGLINGAAAPCVFEQTGTDGTRQVAYSDGRIVEAESDKQYQQLLKQKVAMRSEP